MEQRAKCKLSEDGIAFARQQMYPSADSVIVDDNIDKPGAFSIFNDLVSNILHHHPICFSNMVSCQ